VASVLAGFGLVSNSATTVIASMLVSPIMGPVVGIAYGATIWDRKLVRKAIRTESLSLLFCVLVGMIAATIHGHSSLAEDWPAEEMESRASVQNLIVALPTAFFSGLGVAVSLLDDQTSSLVGVAISASLLPPAVNAAILWVAHAFVDDDNLEAGEEQETRSDYRFMGWVSLLLTFANIGLIAMSSMLMFRMKEKLPIKKNVFWTDLGIARAIYQHRAVITTTDTDSEEEEDEEETWRNQ